MRIKDAHEIPRKYLALFWLLFVANVAGIIVSDTDVKRAIQISDLVILTYFIGRLLVFNSGSSSRSTTR